VLIVGKNVKFRLNQMGQNLSIAGTVIRNIDPRDINKKKMMVFIDSLF
jgi:hypothetical protein